MAEHVPDDPLTTEGSGGGSYARTSRRASSSAPASKLIGVYALLALAVVGMVVLGGVAFRAQADLDALKSQDQSAAARLAEIETRLQITDEDRSRADTAIEGQIDFWEDEIRKLWTIANERNRNWITQNQSGLESQQSKLSEVSGELEGLSAAVARVEAGLGNQREITNRLDVLSRQVTEFGRLVRESTDKANTASITLARLESDVAQMREENAEYQASVDSFRRQVTSRIEALRAQVQAVEARPPPPAPSLGIEGG